MPLLIVQFTECSGISLLVEARKCIRGECSVRCNQRWESHHTVMFSTSLFLKHCVMVLWGWMLQKSSIGYHIWCPECVTVNGAVWKRWVYQILALQGFTHIKLSSVEHEQLWIPKKAILARWWQRQFPNIRDSRNDSQGRVTLVAQASEPRLSFTWCSLITCMRYGLHQMYPVTH